MILSKLACARIPALPFGAKSATCSLKEHAKPRCCDGDRDVHHEMRNMRPFVIAELLRPYDAFQFRIKVREEIGVAQQDPVKKDNIVKLHYRKHDEKTGKKVPETEPASYAIPCGQAEGSDKDQNRGCSEKPAKPAGTAKALFLPVGDCSQIFFWRRREKSFILDQGNACLQKKKVRRHDHDFCDSCEHPAFPAFRIWRLFSRLLPAFRTEPYRPTTGRQAAENHPGHR